MKMLRNSFFFVVRTYFGLMLMVLVQPQAWYFYNDFTKWKPQGPWIIFELTDFTWHENLKIQAIVLRNGKI